MNIEYTPEDIKTINCLNDEICHQAIKLREANEAILRLSHALTSAMVKAETEHYKRAIAKNHSNPQPQRKRKYEL